MNGLTVFTRAVGAWVAGAALLAGAATASDTTLNGPYAAVYAQAYEAMTHGRVVEGATELLHFFRELPADDASITETALGHAQLLTFACSRLMTRSELSRFLQEVVKNEPLHQPGAGHPLPEYPTDMLLRRVLTIRNHGLSQQIAVARQVSWGGQVEHEGVRSASRFVLGIPYGFQGDYVKYRGVRSQVVSNPERALVRAIVEIPVYEALLLARNPAQSREYKDDSHSTLWRAMRARQGIKPGDDRFLLEKLIYWGDDHAQAYTASPGLGVAARSLPTMHTEDLGTAVIAEWAAQLAAPEEDWRVRHTLVRLLEAACVTPFERRLARPALERVAHEPVETADVLRANLALVHFALADHDAEGAFERVRRLVALEQLPTTPDYNAYEAVLLASRAASEYFLRFGHVDLAIRTHRDLGAKYPDTTPSRGELARAKLIEMNGSRIGIERVLSQVDLWVHNAVTMRSISQQDARHYSELVMRTLEDIAEHSPDERTRDAMRDRLARIHEPVGDVLQLHDKYRLSDAFHSTFTRD